MPSDFMLKSTNFVHRMLLRVSFGRVGKDFKGMPVLELTTNGRKSGEPRSVMLTSPLQEGDTIVIVASRGGDDKHPAWFLNLQADPAVQVKWVGGERQPFTARSAMAEERPQLWQKVVARYPIYAGYQTKTDREIPLVMLTPAAAAGSA